ncbi:MAG: class I SAM-dependent methyltransferase, partial [Proteobacteria bacterium]|nr:class I SAM-dependent methyltransferase [Pseudomonadota bacterium]
SMLDYGCGAGDLMRVLGGLGARASFTGCDVSTGMLAEVSRRWPSSLGAAPATAAQDGARTPFAAGQFDVATISAVLHHVPVAERAAVYAELGRVLKPGGRLYVFEHNPRNPLVRYVIARTPIDENAILLDAHEVREGLLGAARYELDTEYLMFMPPGVAFLRPVDRVLAWLPLGAQYAVAARKPA